LPCPAHHPHPNCPRLGNGSIALGLGTTFVVSIETVDRGVQGVAGGYLDAGAACSDAANDQARYAARWTGIQLTTSGASKLGLEESHTTSRLSGVAQEDGVVSAAAWCAPGPARASCAAGGGVRSRSSGPGAQAVRGEPARPWHGTA
jgi:hypothetical protein